MLSIDVSNSTQSNSSLSKPAVQKILHVDDHALFSDGLAHVLKNSSLDCDVVSVNNAETALNHIKNDQQQLDLLLLDLSMPDLDGLSLMNKLVSLGICIPIAVMSASEDIGKIQQAIKLGAVAYLSKSMDTNELVTALKLIHLGETYIPENIQMALSNCQRLPSKLERALAVGISHRQYDVLEHMHKGLSNRNIGAALFVSESTIKSHIQILFQAMDASNRLDCVRKAETLGML